MSSPTDAAIATIADLNKLTQEFGAFSIAENATNPTWIAEQRQKVVATIAKTRHELRRLESSLQRLEHVAATMGADGSTLKIEREFIPLEGWALTLVDNYATLVGNLSQYDRKQLFERLSEYTRGVILTANGGNASHTLGKVRAYLGDRALFY
jgi:hypothetical protein